MYVCCLIGINKYLTSLLFKNEFFSRPIWQSTMYAEADVRMGDGEGQPDADKALWA